MLIDQQRHLIYRNAAAGRVLSARAGLQVRDKQLVITTSNGDARLRETIADCMNSGHSTAWTCRGLKVRRRSSSGDWLILISRATDADSCFFIVHLVSRVHTRHLPVTALQDIYGLTHKEIDVVSRLLKRESMHVIAQRMNLSHETIRAYMKRIFRKCEVRSQSALISVLQRLSLLLKRD